MAPKRSPAAAPGKGAAKGKTSAKAKARPSQPRNPSDVGLQYSSLGGFGPIHTIDFQSDNDSSVQDAVVSALTNLRNGVAADDRGLRGLSNFVAITSIEMSIHPRATDVPTTLITGCKGDLRLRPLHSA